MQFQRQEPTAEPHPSRSDTRKGAKGAKGMTGQKNSKLEIRNSKQIQMIKKHKISNKLVLDFDF
jgi:hypothetical protein